MPKGLFKEKSALKPRPRRTPPRRSTCVVAWNPLVASTAFNLPAPVLSVNIDAGRSQMAIMSLIPKQLALHYFMQQRTDAVMARTGALEHALDLFPIRKPHRRARRVNHQLLC